jgi:hypothetical protein
VSHIIGELRQFASTAEAISVWRPIHAWVGLRQIRNELAAIRASHDTVLSEWFARLSEPVEGGTDMQNAWLQAYSTAEGTSAILQLLSSRQAVSEAIDRKSAYSMAIFSLYIAVASLVLSIVLGVLAVR